ncbi:hypothetical protein [Teredinibacter haidensis]|uniref:hypothetical protein n=1 Tax=Teredinibacter haidensis TaxID=2731755 RepID=UPI000948AB18|nr:hypothetical protein [Teredinibacter haidensis]
MKARHQLALFLLSIVFSTSSYAELTLTNADKTEEAQTCINAVMDESFKVTAETKMIKCNGLPIKKFVKKYRKLQLEADNINVNVYKLYPSDKNIETQLCIAAANGKQELKALAKKAKYGDYSKIECNGEKIMAFAQKYSQ